MIYIDQNIIKKMKMLKKKIALGIDDFKEVIKENHILEEEQKLYKKQLKKRIC